MKSWPNEKVRIARPWSKSVLTSSFGLKPTAGVQGCKKGTFQGQNKMFTSKCCLDLRQVPDKTKMNQKKVKRWGPTKSMQNKFLT